ncbi:MAG: hypothetical protein E6R08_06505 [Nevskiaceae bacterium]|nr:MAG: hypothetical protein E6R08_06505 [Nevskiaceae bacterium]
MITDDAVNRYMALFRGNPRSHGQWNPKVKDQDKASKTEAVPYTDQVYRNHLNGKMGLGIVPIYDDATCFWGAIDIDNHGSDHDLDIATIEQKVNALKLPLVTCRSKSGGVHLFMFGRETLRAVQVNSILKRWAADLGIEGTDCIFPKQTKLERDEDGSRQKGNWINLPYFDADATVRFAVENGKRLSLELFLSLAEDRRVTSTDLDKMYEGDHSEAPPCIQQGIADKIGSGQRNEFAYNVTIYMKKRYPEDFRDRMFDLNNDMFENPMPFTELKKVVNSAGRRDYRYKCNLDPCKSLCDRKTCLTRKFGITQDQADEMDQELMLPEFTSLIQYETEPVRWEIMVEGKTLLLSTEELFDWRILRMRIAEKLRRVVPAIKNDKWQKLLSMLMSQVQIKLAPEDASAAGIIRTQLLVFIQKTDLTDTGRDIEGRAGLLRGIPVVQEIEGVRSVYFRGQDFTTFLKRNKSEDLKGVNLWFALKNMGVKHGRIRVGKQLVTTWSLEVTNDHQLDIPIPDFTPEI